jgi:hypothetical protein
MKRMMGLLSVLVIAAFFARPAFAYRDEVDDLLERYLAAYNNGDAAALAELYCAERFSCRTTRQAPAEGRRSSNSGGGPCNSTPLGGWDARSRRS